MGIFQRGKFLVDGNFPKGVDGNFPKGQIFGRWEFSKGANFLVDGNFSKGQFFGRGNFPKGQNFWEFS